MPNDDDRVENRARLTMVGVIRQTNEVHYTNSWEYSTILGVGYKLYFYDLLFVAGIKSKLAEDIESDLFS